MKFILRIRFLYHRYFWKKQTKYNSNPDKIFSNKHYLAIIQLGRPVIPLLISDIIRNNNRWFFALEKITGENPVPKNFAGIITAMNNFWITWYNVQQKENN